jgi:DnaJ-class molecular chaperone
MSHLSKPILEINPPVLTTFTKRNETFTVGGHTCPYCNGKGLVCGRQTGADEYDADTCPVCGGTGSLRAEITIRWSSEKMSN